MKYLKSWENQLVCIFVISLIATTGSLYFSIVMKFIPCDLCWYQRISMYPVAMISLVGIAIKEPKTVFYIAPLIGLGTIVAIYHNLLYFGVIEEIVPCTAGVSCSTRYIRWLGFLTIPSMSLIAHLGIAFISIYSFLSIKGVKNEK